MPEAHAITSAPLRALGAGLATSLLLAAAPAALAATPKTCDKLHGRDLVTGRVIHVVRLRLPTLAPRGPNAGTEHRTGLFGCRLPNGPVHRLASGGQSYFTGQGNSPVESTAVRIGTSAGRFATVTETNNTLMGEAFLTDRVVNVATGHRLYTYLNTSSNPTQPSLAAPFRTLLNPTGKLVALFPVLDADGNHKTDRLVAFVNAKGQALDTAEAGSIPIASITLTANVVTWTDAGIVKSATIAPPVTADSAGTAGTAIWRFQTND